MLMKGRALVYGRHAFWRWWALDQGPVRHDSAVTVTFACPYLRRLCQTAEETVGVELTRPLPRDALGEVIAGGATVDAPIVRTTRADATHASIR